MRWSSTALLLAGAAALWQGPLHAAEPKAYRLVPKTLEGIQHGKAVVVKGSTGGQPHRFLLDKLTSEMPIVVALRPVKKGDEVELNLTKYGWNQPLRSGATNGEILSYKFRTEGEFQIAVSSKELGKPYRLLVWVGDVVKPEFSPVVVSADSFETESASWTEHLPWIVAGIALAIAALLGWKLLGRKTS